MDRVDPVEFPVVLDAVDLRRVGEDAGPPGRALTAPSSQLPSHSL